MEELLLKHLEKQIKVGLFVGMSYNRLVLSKEIFQEISVRQYNYLSITCEIIESSTQQSWLIDMSKAKWDDTNLSNRLSNISIIEETLKQQGVVVEFKFNIPPMDKFVPKIIEEGSHVYLEMLLEGEKCHLCKKIMIAVVSPYRPKIFPAYMKLNQKAQMETIGLVFTSSCLVDDHAICHECVEAGKADFLCVLCGERKPSNQVQESIGDPAEFLCTGCYNTKSAKEWDEKVDELQEEHKYDFQ